MPQKLLLFKDKSVLVAEDDIITNAQMTKVLSILFGKVYSAQNGKEAYKLYQDESPDIIIADIKMPKKDGLSLIKQIRQNNYDIPIILLTSFTEQDLLIRAANLSIDGYLLKPISIENLSLALKKAMQRSNKDMEEFLLSKDLVYNFATKELYNNNILIELGLKERELLILLINRLNKTVTKEEIEKELWPLDPISDSTLKKSILRLRTKLGSDIIATVRGVGYRLDAVNNKED